MESESDDDGFSFEVGQRVEVLWEDEWYSGEILEELDDGFYKVDVDYDDEEWHHTTDDIRPGVSRQEWMQDDLDDVKRRYHEDDGDVVDVEINFDSDWESECESESVWMTVAALVNSFHLSSRHLDGSCSIATSPPTRRSCSVGMVRGDLKKSCKRCNLVWKRQLWRCLLRYWSLLKIVFLLIGGRYISHC